MEQRIIDAHMHPNFGDPESIKAAKDANVDFTLEGLLNDFKKYNIVKAVAVPSETDENFVFGNQKIKIIVSEKPETFIGVCTINPLKYTPKQLTSIENDIKKGIFKAIKLFPGYVYFYPNQSECNPIYEMAERNKIPVLIHTGGVTDSKARLKYTHPISVDDIAVSFPKVNFVICHFGNPWIAESVEILYKNKNVYADLSGFVGGKVDLTFKKYYKGRLKAMMEGIYYEFSNVDKIMFGTDYPLTNYEFYIKFIRKLKLGKKEFQRIFFDTAAKLFNVKV